MTEFYTLEKGFLKVLWSCSKWKCAAGLWNDNFSAATDFDWRPTNDWFHAAKEYVRVAVKYTNNKWHDEDTLEARLS